MSDSTSRDTSPQHRASLVTSTLVTRERTETPAKSMSILCWFQPKAAATNGVVMVSCAELTGDIHELLIVAAIFVSLRHCSKVQRVHRAGCKHVLERIEHCNALDDRNGLGDCKGSTTVTGSATVTRSTTVTDSATVTSSVSIFYFDLNWRGQHVRCFK